MKAASRQLAFALTKMPLVAGFCGSALLTLGSQPSEAQTYVDRRKPSFVADSSVVPSGWYNSVQEAFAAHKAWREANYCGSNVSGRTCTITELQVCSNNAIIHWGEPGSWCWREVRQLYGVTEFDGITGGISAIDVCPDGYTKVTKLVSGNGTVANPWNYKNECEIAKPRICPGECGSGNPIYPGSGTKRQVERDYASADGRLTFARVYHSDWGQFRSEFDIEFIPPTRHVGTACAVARFSVSGQSFPKCFDALNAANTGGKAVFVGMDGARIEFNWDGSEGTSAYPYAKDRLTRIDADGTSRWLLARRHENRYLVFDDEGLLVAVQSAAGPKVTVSRNGRYLSLIRDEVSGRSLQVADGPGGLASLTDPDGNVIVYHPAVTVRQTASVTWPDQHLRTYLWDEPGLASGASSSGQSINRLTGVVDENGDRFASFGYSAGKAISTEYSGGVNKYTIADGRTNGTGPLSLTAPNGATISSIYAVVAGVSRPTSHSQPAGAGCAASTSSQSFDANGNVARRDDFNGNRVCYSHDLNRNLEVVRLEGLASAVACPADLAAYSIAAGSNLRKTTTLWHPDWSLPVKRAEPGRTITNVYNGQPDPTAGNVTASCAPAGAVLPDGKPIAVLCKKVEQATTDATGTMGFGAAVTGVARTWTYTYNEHGQLLTSRDPQNNAVTHLYYGDTTDQHTRGDLQSVTNASGQVTTYTRYDKSGRVLRSIDANGGVTDVTYTPRGWFNTVTVTPSGAAPQITAYEYDGVGQMKKATLPDGTVLEYSYDAAHRLTGVKDGAGNSAAYTLDGMGNRTSETLKDPSGALVRSLTRAYDALNRVQSEAAGLQ